MDKQLFLENVKKQFIDAEDIQLTEDMEFRSIDSYDSLTGMTIMVMIKDEYSVDLLEQEYKEQKTIDELYSLVKSKTMA